MKSCTTNLLQRRVRTAGGFGRRGMTFLEVVLAIALMGLIFAAVYSAFGFVGAMSRREQQKLAAAELANALIVQYLDDPNSLPTTQPIDYGPWRFRYARAEEDVNFREARPASATTRNAPKTTPKQFTVTVWLSEESEGGSYDPDTSVPQVALTRIVVPLTVRNPDSFNNMFATDAGRRSMSEAAQGAIGLPATGPGGGSKSGGTRAPRAPKGGAVLPSNGDGGKGK